MLHVLSKFFLCLSIYLEDASVRRYLQEGQVLIVGLWQFWSLNPEFIVNSHNYDLTNVSSVTVTVPFILPSFISRTQLAIFSLQDYSWPLNSAGLNCTGPLVHRYFSVNFVELTHTPQWGENCKAYCSAESSALIGFSPIQWVASTWFQIGPQENCRYLQRFLLLWKKDFGRDLTRSLFLLLFILQISAKYLNPIYT